MNRRSFLYRTGAASLVTLITPDSIVYAVRRSAETSLEAGFKNPPAIAKPFTWWHWMNGNISKQGITLDLEAMQRVGIGGVQCFNVGSNIPKGPVDYLGPEWLALTKHAINEAGRLGLEFDMHNCPGWSSSGGPWITPEMAMQQIVWSQVFVNGGKEVTTDLPKPFAQFNFYKDTYVLAYPSVEGEEEGKAVLLDNWMAKANFPAKGGDPATTPPPGPPALEAVIKTPSPASVIQSGSVIDISRYMDKEGKLTWKAPAGKWTILRMGHTAVNRKNNAAPDSGAGLECDKYSWKAYEFHFNKMFDNLLPVMKLWAGKTRVGLLVDSYEVGRQNWTPEMASQFKQLRGYDLVKYLPAVTGKIVDSIDTTERFLWDFRRTHADMMSTDYYAYFAALCKKHGILSYTEPYNNGPFEEMQAGSHMDINMGEFWIRGPHFYPSVKLAASVMHVFGKRTDDRQIVGAESFTGDAVHSKWQEHPYALKAHGDYMYTKGLNRFIFHRYAHQPHSTAVPGMTMGPWGFHFDRTNTWFEKGKSWLQYAGRCQSILQRGMFNADILYFTGDEMPGDDISSMPNPNPAPPEGYDWDFINRDAMLTRTAIRNNRIVFPDGLSYKILVLPAKKIITIETLRRIRDLVRKGMILAGPPPQTTPGLSTYEKNNAELLTIVTELWGNDSSSSAERNVGLGRVFPDQPLKDILNKLHIQPDFSFTSRSGNAPINYIHKTIGGSEIYFIANRRRSKEELVASFRVTGKQPELWNAATGEITPVQIYMVAAGRTAIPLQLDPAGSLFIVFRSPAAVKPIKAIEKEHTVILSADRFTAAQPGRNRDLTNSFTISAWVKPESEEGLSGKYGMGRGIASYVVCPAEGEKLYGKKHVSCGLVAARNGILVCERSTDSPVTVLSAPMPLAGWTHITLVYDNGAPALYVNGKPAGKAAASGNTVHPAVGESFYQDRYSWFFEGDMAGLQLSEDVLTTERIQQLFEEGKPLPDAPFSVQPASAGDKKGLLFWENGQYTLHNSEGKKRLVKIADAGKQLDLDGPWQVNFPPDRGAPPTIQLPALESWHKHSEDGVKYFSGTAVYNKQFRLGMDALKANKQLFLDLGRVEVIAEVKLNGNMLETLWKPPYITDITKYAKAGINDLEVHVTNLWPNRLIGDEHLPEENEYGPLNASGATGSSATGAIWKLPEWYVKDLPKPAGGRITFATWRHYNKDAPLLESGLLGPVVIRAAVIG